jgi:anti-sigma B factor antagonist
MSDVIRPSGPPVAASVHWPNPRMCVVRLAVDLDLATTPQLTSYLREQTSTGPAHLVVDLAEVRFMASPGINLILTAMSNAEGVHGRLHLTGVTDNRVVVRVLELCGLLPASTSTKTSTNCSTTPDHD